MQRVDICHNEIGIFLIFSFQVKYPREVTYFYSFHCFDYQYSCRLITTKNKVILNMELSYVSCLPAIYLCQ